VTGSLTEVFVSDRYKVTSWLTLIAGLRYSHFDSGSVSGGTPGGCRRECPRSSRGASRSKCPPELGVSRILRRLLPTASAIDGHRPLIDLANSQSLTFGPLQGERDHEYQFGVAIPFHGWVLDTDTFKTSARNWLDHSNIGESNLFWPLTWDRLDSRLGGHAAFSASVAPRQAHFAYSQPDAEDSAPFTGGLICPTQLRMDASQILDSLLSTTIRETL